MTRRLHIDRLELDLRGIPPATADRAVRLLGPALARTIEGRGATMVKQREVDAGRIESSAGAEPQALAERIAARIGERIFGGRS